MPKPLSPGLEAIVKAYRTKPKDRIEQSGVVYWYDVAPVHGKQEIRKPIRFFTLSERVRLLAEAGARIAREIEDISAPRRGKMRQRA
jgi:hypothetical protein